MREKLEYSVVWIMVHALRILPRGMARRIGAMLGMMAWHAVPRLRHVGHCNLRLSFPEWTEARRKAVLRRLYRNLGWQLAEFCQMSKYTPEQSQKFIRYEGLENYLAARERGRGVLIATGHLGAWELSSFWHSLMGYPMSMVIRRLDNERVDELVNRIRCLHGNRVLHKDDFARGLIGAMRKGETVGILMDTNMTPPQGVFVPYFGRPACTASGLARVARKTGAAVLPGFLLWEEAERKYVLHFGPQIEIAANGKDEDDAVTNTARFTAVIENYVRQYPDQWLWVHRRWKTRPAGETPIYTKK